MISLIDELKNNFDVKEISSNVSVTIEGDVEGSHNKAIANIIEILKKKGYKSFNVPVMPVPFVVDNRSGKFKAYVHLVE